MLEEYRQEENNTLPTHLKSTFKAFRDDFLAVTQRYIDTHMRGIPRPPTPYMVSVDSPKTSSTSIPLLPDTTVSLPPSVSRSGPYGPPTSYAEVALKSRYILQNYSSTSPSTASSQAQKKTPFQKTDFLNDSTPPTKSKLSLDIQ